MVWFWKKKKQAAANGNDASAAGGTMAGSATAGTAVGTSAAADAAVEAALASAQRSDKEWRRQAARLREQEKRVEKERARAAKRELTLMKKQARAARRERRKAEKRAHKQAKVVLKIHKREQKAERKRVQAIAKMRRRRQKHGEKLLRKRQKEERKRQKEERKRSRSGEVSEPVATVADEASANAPQLVAPTFKEDSRCKSCSSQFQRLPTRRRHHCRNCGESFCSKCLSRVKRPIPWFKLDKPQKVCFSCDVQVFHGMGGTTTRATTSSPVASTTPSPATPSAEVAQVQQPEETAVGRSPLLTQRSASFQSEQPEDSPRTSSSPGSRSGLSFRLRPRSRRDTNSSKSKRGGSIWTLPIRPLLKRKASTDQLRNRTWDLDLRIEKEEMLARQRQSQMVVVTRAPQFATAS